MAIEVDAANLLANPGFESLTGDQPDRWDHFVQPKPGAVARLDDTAHHGDYAVWLHTPSPYAKEPVNNWSQNVIGEFGGKTLRIAGFIRVAEAKEAAIWLQCWRKQPWAVLSAASTSIEMPVYGTSDWQEVTMNVDVPLDTDFVTVRCVLLGTGSAWFDDVSVTLVGDADAEPVSVDSKDSKDSKDDGVEKDVEVEASTPEPDTVPWPAPPPSVTTEAAKRQEEMVIPLVTRLEGEVMRLRDTNVLLADTLAQIQEVNQGLVAEMIAMQAEIQALKEDDSEASAPSIAPRLRVPPLIPLSEAPGKTTP